MRSALRRAILYLSLSVLCLPFAVRADDCDLLLAESNTLLEQAVSAPDLSAAQPLISTAQYYLASCVGTPADSEFETIWSYDAAVPDELARWGSFGYTDWQTWAVVDSGDDAYFQGAASGFAPLRNNAFEVSNILTYPHEGQPLDVYPVPFDAAVRPLALLDQGRTEHTFIDPANPSGEPVIWAGDFRALDPLLKPVVALEIGARVRLDTPESAFSLVLTNAGQSALLSFSENRLSVEVRYGNLLQLQTAEVLSSLTVDAVTPDVGEWLNVRLRANSSRLYAYVDDTLVADVAQDTFYMRGNILAGILTSPAPATVRIDDLSVRTNAPNA